MGLSPLGGEPTPITRQTAHGFTIEWPGLSRRAGTARPRIFWLEFLSYWSPDNLQFSAPQNNPIVSFCNTEQYTMYQFR